MASASRLFCLAGEPDLHTLSISVLEDLIASFFMREKRQALALTEHIYPASKIPERVPVTLKKCFMKAARLSFLCAFLLSTPMGFSEVTNLLPCSGFYTLMRELFIQTWLSEDPDFKPHAKTTHEPCTSSSVVGLRMRERSSCLRHTESRPTAMLELSLVASGVEMTVVEGLDIVVSGDTIFQPRV